MFRKLFGLKSKADSETTKQLPPIYESSHPAAGEIKEAEAVIAQVIDMKLGDRMLISFNLEDYLRVKEIMDRAIAKCPNDADLLYARASLHYLAMQGEDGMKDRDHCLTLAPGHFDAGMSKAHFKSWNGVLHFPGWDESSARISDVIARYIEMGQTAQIIRDHLKGAFAVFIQSSQVKMEGCHKMRWDLKWVDTPYGKIAAHYLFLDNGQFVELFIPHLSDAEPKANTNYWILRRLANLSYCFIAIIQGRTVIRNERYIFPPKLVNALKSMEADLIKDGPAASMGHCQKAAQWYMQNSDVSSLKY